MEVNPYEAPRIAAESFQGEGLKLGHRTLPRVLLAAHTAFIGWIMSGLFFVDPTATIAWPTSFAAAGAIVGYFWCAFLQWHIARSSSRHMPSSARQ